MEKQKNAVGRRKEAVTRVFLSKGDGKITVNGKDYKTYFPTTFILYNKYPAVSFVFVKESVSPG